MVRPDIACCFGYAAMGGVPTHPEKLTVVAGKECHPLLRLQPAGEVSLLLPYRRDTSGYTTYRSVNTPKMEFIMSRKTRFCETWKKLVS